MLQLFHAYSLSTETNITHHLRMLALITKFRFWKLSMNAEKLLLTTDAQGRITGLPQFEPYQEVELIVLFPEKTAVTSKSVYRTPPVELAGKIKILADIIAPATTVATTVLKKDSASERRNVRHHARFA